MGKLLIVDDSKFIRNYLKKLLSKQGYRSFVEAESGEEAIEKYMFFKPDLVILDITLPCISGMDVLKKIMEYDPEANIVMCSALNTRWNVTKARDLGAKGFVVKPYFRDVIDIINEVLPAKCC